MNWNLTDNATSSSIVTAAAGVHGVVLLQVAGELQPHRRFAGAFFSEDHCSRRILRIAVNLVPGRMVRAGDAVLLEHRIGLRVFFRKGIGRDGVMLEKLLGLHARVRSVALIWP